MNTPEPKYSFCPDCGRKTVYFRMWRGGEDHYQCRRKACDFFFYTGGDSRIDAENRERWEKLNQAESIKTETGDD